MILTFFPCSFLSFPPAKDSRKGQSVGSQPYIMDKIDILANLWYYTLINYRSNSYPSDETAGLLTTNAGSLHSLGMLTAFISQS